MTKPGLSNDPIRDSRRGNWRWIITWFGILAGSFFSASTMAQTHDQTPIELAGFSVSEAFEIRDGQTLDVASVDFHKMIYRVLQTSTMNLRKYALFSSEVSWQQIIDDLPEYRLWVFARQGRVKSVTPIRLPGTDHETPIKSVYRADCVSDSGEKFQVITLRSPAAWKSATDLDEPIQFVGFLFANVAPDLPVDAVEANDQPPANQESNPASNDQANPAANNGPPMQVPLFIAKHLSWFPTAVNPDLQVTESRVLLAEHGVDIGGLDLVRREHTKGLGTADAEVFFQFLSAVERIRREPSGKRLDCDELLRNSTEGFGNAVGFRARVRQCTQVQRPATSTGEPLEFEHYFQLVVFPDLDAQVVVKNEGHDDLLYRRFPVTVCCRSLPDGMTPAQIENQQIWVNGFYFRFWKYGSELTNAAEATGQLSPLIISRQPLMIAMGETQLDFFRSSMLIALIIGMCWTIWVLNSAWKQKKRSGPDLPERIEVTNLE